MRRWVFGMILAFPAAALAGSTDPASWPAIRAGWNAPAEAFHVIGNIYYVGTQELASWLITTPAGHILLDGALTESAPLVEKNIRALGFSIKDVKILFNSHAHFDHSGGLAQLKRDSGAILIASAGDRESLENGKYLGSEDRREMDAPPVSVDRIVADGEVVSLGGVSLEAHLTPGHTRGCTTWTMTVSEAGNAYAVVFFCSATVSANRLVPVEQYPGIIEDYRSTFKKLKTMPADVFLSNHQGFFRLWEKRAAQKTGGANPFIDAKEFSAFISRAALEFEADLAKQRNAQAGLTR